MPFSVKDWQNSPSTATPLSAAALEDMETRLSGYTDSSKAFIDVKAYGAVGNGSTNDVPAINSAMAAANSAGGGIVYLSPTTGGAGYGFDLPTTSDFIQCYSNVTVLGSGYSGRLTRVGTFLKDTGRHLFKAPTASGAISNFELRNVYVDGQADQVTLGTTTLSAGITAPTATISLTNAAGFPATGTVLITGITGQINYTGKSGNNLTGCTGGTGTVSAGANVYEGIQDFSYRTLRLETVSAGAAATPVHQSVRILDNTIADWPGGCIDLQDTQSFAVRGNHLIAPKRGGIILWYDCAYGVVANNTVQGGLDDCIAVQSNSNTDGNAGGTGTHHVAITGNSLIEGEQSPQSENNVISIQGGYDYAITGNVCDNGGLQGVNKAAINLDQSDGATPIALKRVVVSGNIIRQSGNDYGVRLVGATVNLADISITGNHISNTQDEAITVDYPVTNLVIANNIVRDANRLNTAAVNAINIAGTVDNYLISGNVVNDSTGYAKYGILVNAGTNDGAVIGNMTPDADFPTGAGVHVNPAISPFVMQGTGEETTKAMKSWVTALDTDTAIQTKVTGDAVNRFTLRADGRLSWGDGALAQDAIIQRRAADSIATGTGDNLWIGTTTSGGNGHIQLFEQTASTTASVDAAKLFCQDNGAGKTQLVVRFNTGAAIVLATQA